MKIGIVTWLWHENYGTALQAYALQRYLRNHNYDVSLLDVDISDKANVKKTITYYFNRAFYKIDMVLNKSDYRLKTMRFINFIRNNVKKTTKIHSDTDYIKACNSFDLLLFGSDQIWNPNWYHKYYFANFEEVKTRRISYAPSFGVSEMNKGMEAFYADALASFQEITVREGDGAEIVEELIGRRPEVVVDPTFLLNCNEWAKIEARPHRLPEKYILCYFLSDNWKHWRAARRFSKKYGLPLVVLPNTGSSCIRTRHFMRDAGPSEFIYLIRNADYVITDSFHGAVFSVIFEKKFAIFERHKQTSRRSQNSRLLNLKIILNNQLNIIPYGSAIINENWIDYELIRATLEKKINGSKEKLKDMIGEENG
ncbi:polysaccharide pyruvyl transferase family protein [Candidatus Saccharibacteria bacterium]|nr:polysaccharide pyruvyl transferase family protein [Candidatus Saccharibacteria bacterium]